MPTPCIFIHHDRLLAVLAKRMRALEDADVACSFFEHLLWSYFSFSILRYFQMSSQLPEHRMACSSKNCTQALLIKIIWNFYSTIELIKMLFSFVLYHLQILGDF